MLYTHVASATEKMFEIPFGIDAVSNVLETHMIEKIDHDRIYERVLGISIPKTGIKMKLFVTTDYRFKASTT